MLIETKLGTDSKVENFLPQTLKKLWLIRSLLLTIVAGNLKNREQSLDSGALGASLLFMHQSITLLSIL